MTYCQKRADARKSRHGQQAVYVVLPRIAAQPNSRLPAAEEIDIHPPPASAHSAPEGRPREGVSRRPWSYRATRLERYIWRYIQASEVEMEEALTDLWD